MKTRFWIFFAAVGALSAQQVVAPTPEPVGSPRGENHGNYNITNSFEFGYRWSLVGGDDGRIPQRRELSQRLATAGQQPFDRFQGRPRALLRPDSAEHDGAGQRSVRVGDPADSEEPAVPLRHDVAAERLLQSGADGGGRTAFMDTVRRMQDHDFTLFPQSQVPGAGGIQPQHAGRSDADHSLELDNNSAHSTGLPVFANLRREWNEYRFGADVEFAGFKFTVLRRWDFYQGGHALPALPGPTRRRSGCPTT